MTVHPSPLTPEQEGGLRAWVDRAEDRRLRLCPGCEKPLVGKRPNAKHHGEACRSKARRRAKAKPAVDFSDPYLKLSPDEHEAFQRRADQPCRCDEFTDCGPIIDYIAATGAGVCYKCTRPLPDVPKRPALNTNGTLSVMTSNRGLGDGGANYGRKRVAEAWQAL